MAGRPAAECCFVAEAIAAGSGKPGLRRLIDQARRALQQIGSGFDQVPASWWQVAQVDPEDIEEALSNRLDRLPTILNIEAWGEFDYEQYGGIEIV